MRLSGYQVLSQIAAGPDGLAYRAAAPEAPGRLVEVRTLEPARSDPARWGALAHRIRAAALLDHEAVSRIIEFRDAETPPVVVMAWRASQPMAEALAGAAPLPEIRAVRLARELAGALSEAHRLGLPHGAIGPGSVRITSAGSALLDLTGIDLGEPCARGGEPSADVERLGALLHWMATGHTLAESPGSRIGSASQAATLAEPSRGDAVERLERLIAEMTDPAPASRPSVREVVERLDAILALIASAVTAPTIDAPGHTSDPLASTTKGEAATDEPPQVKVRDITDRQTLGRYRLCEKLGQGGMGAVYRGEDLADGATVALKILRPEWSSRSGALKRFRKEARLLGEVNNPYVTNLLEVNEDDGLHFLVLEFVKGKSLGQILHERGALPEPEALAILSDVARALVDAHARGIVHRDIKPDNILLAELPDGSRRVKLSDFGLARHVEQSESMQMTQARAVVGTPQYMAPEQGSGGTIDPRTDVYSMGVTLFLMLSGQAPFSAQGLMELIALHCNEPPPSLQALNPAISDGAVRIVAKALAKSPDDRYPDAGALLEAIDSLLRGELTPEASHPKLPPADEKDVLAFDFAWDLESAPRLLWPMITNTERLNHAIGLPPVTFHQEIDPKTGAVRRFGEARQGGILAEWEEFPFEWVEPRRMGVLREYRRGPFRWMVSAVELVPRGKGGTTLHHRVRIAPRGALMRAAASLKIGRDTRRALERVYRRIDEAVSGRLTGAGAIDPFEEPPPLPTPRRKRLERLLGGLREHGIGEATVEALGDFLAAAPAQEVTRIRPIALARRLGLDPNVVISACLHGARDGLFILLWDLLCPLCRIPSEVQDTLKNLRDHGHCEACNLDYELDFANSVEMIFRVHPEVREADLGVYCIGGPAHSPHVVAQVRVGAGERVALDLGLSEGAYQIRGPRLPHAHEFRVEPSTGPRRLDLDLRAGPGPDAPKTLRAGGQTLTLRNDFEEELTVRIERTASRDDALTAARASSLALFRELFPGEVLSPGQLISVAATTLLQTAIQDPDALYAELGDARAFQAIHEQVLLLESRIKKGGGALVKTVGEGVLAAFSDAASAVRVGLDLADVLASGKFTRALPVKACVHRGPAMAATINDHLDYFGLTVAQAAALARIAAPGELILSSSVAADPAVMAALRARGREGEIARADLPGAPDSLVHRIRLGPGG